LQSAKQQPTYFHFAATFVLQNGLQSACHLAESENAIALKPIPNYLQNAILAFSSK
jgi:hypothetical protein